VPAGDAFTESQQHELSRAIDEAKQVSGWDFAIEVGAASTQGSRVYAESLHARLPDPEGSVLIQVDPERRTLEIVTGARVRRTLDNRGAALAALTMQSAFAGGDLARGLLAGLQQLARLARSPKSLHTDTP
jgi:uncharacterized membrane protein YgcG